MKNTFWSTLRPYRIHRAHYATPLYPPKLAVTSLTSGGRLVDIVRSRTQATKFVYFLQYNSNVINFAVTEL
jgi:hypothetical protein